MIQAKVIADSKNPFGNRITTMVVTFPRIILAEFNTHRMFSRNSASSRAIPFEKMLKSVKENPFIPIAFQKDHKGMQGTEYLTNDAASIAKNRWLDARWRAMEQAEMMSDSGATKQLCNRLLEPFMWHTVIVTATDFENFFHLRCPKYVRVHGKGETEYRSRKDFSRDETDNGSMMAPHRTESDWLLLNKGQAEIHMMALAEAMWDAFNESIPRQLKAGEWHIPFGDDLPALSSPSEELAAIKVATARCARVSYTVVGEEGKPTDIQKDIELHDRLAASGHWSPMEHCAKAMDSYVYDRHPNGFSGNLKGFVQYRKTFVNENVTK